MLRTNEDEAERLERVALAYLLDAANARLRDLEERVCRLENTYVRNRTWITILSDLIDSMASSFYFADPADAARSKIPRARIPN
jgi:hypothetical protein